MIINNPTSERFLWTCELSKDAPAKIWKAADLMEFEDDDDKDYMINSLICKSAVLGVKAVDGERNVVAIKTKSHQDKEIEQPIFSLCLGRNDMVSGLDLTLASENNQEVEFKLISGTGPVFVTCTHMVEMPSGDEQHTTIMTTSDGEDLDCEDEVGELDEADKVTGKRNAATNGNVVTKKVANGVNINGAPAEAMVEEK